MNYLNVIDGFSIFGLHIPFYGLFIAIAMVVGVAVACKLAKRRNLTSDDIFLLALYVIPLAIIGARLYYVAFSERTYTFLEVFKIWEGGLAILGGVIGGAVGVILFCSIHKKNFLNVADVAVVALILGQGIGRIGCYFAGCCYGIEVANQSLMWFPFATQINGVWHYSTFFYEAFWDILVFVALLLVIRKNNTKGALLSLYLICYGVGRCIIETFRGDSLYIGIFKVSQLLSALMIIGGIILIVVIYTIKKKKGVNNNENNNKNNS